ncbi:MAG TPA: hypothetical protein VLV90_07945 [Burkholderiales bacterium]|nr:hypothetical protein [Burkholderiales bacterium]
MPARLARFAVFAAAAAAVPCLALAQALPADCSAAPVPAQALEISIGGAKFAPKSVKLIAAGEMGIGDEKFDSYRLSFRNEDDLFAPLEATVTVIVRKGQRVDGRTFRKLPTKSIDKQPAATSGLPEVQGWSMKNKTAKTDQSHVSYVGSLRLEFGQRQGGAIGGRIHLCVPKGQTTMFDSTPSKEDDFAIGTFQARIE